MASHSRGHNTFEYYGRFASQGYWGATEFRIAYQIRPNPS